MAGNEVVKVQCPECGGGLRNHKVQREFETTWDTDDDHGGAKHQIVQCQGCDDVRFRVESYSTFDIEPESGDLEAFVHVYPELPRDERKAAIDNHDEALPENVNRIYRETISAMNAGAPILAGAGLRAIVEAICMNAKVPRGNLQSKIDGLVKKGLLAQPQADLLHEERYLGNAAVHEVEPPARRDIEDGLMIVEALLNTMYVVPLSAERLRNKRVKKAAATAAAHTAAPAKKP